MFTRYQQDVVLKLNRRKAGAASVVGEFALGNILIAAGEITSTQLEGALRRQAATGLRLGEELIHAGHASNDQVESGLLLQHKLIAYVLTVTVGLVPLVAVMPSAEANQSSVAMSVSVRVIANAKVQSDYQAMQLKITDDDVARGYVEIAAASRFSVSTNSRFGYLMEFYPIGNLFESVLVGGLSRAVQLGADGGVIVQRGPLSSNLAHELSFRFTLRPDALPGSYPWPLLLSVRPL